MNNIVSLRQTPAPFFLEEPYALGYIALSVSSDEERILGNAIRDQFELHKAGSHSLLDIGCADGRITRQIAGHFDKISVYEPNSLLFSLAMSQLVQWAQRLDGRNATFPDPGRSNTHFDAILASHVLYHLDFGQWAEFFDAAQRQMSASSLMIVVLWNRHSEARRYAETVDSSRWLCTAESLLGLKPKFDVGSVDLQIVSTVELDPVIKAHSRETAILITDFLLGKMASSRHRNVPATQDFENALLGNGVRNSQTVIALKKLGG